MARKPKRAYAETQPSVDNGSNVMALTKELWQAAVNLRGSIEPADYKRYVLPIIFLRSVNLAIRDSSLRSSSMLCNPWTTLDFYCSFAECLISSFARPDIRFARR